MITDTEPPDELEVPHLKARLWHELAELHHEQRPGQSPAPRPVVHLTRPRSRRSLAAVSAAAAALVAGLVAGQLGGSPSETPLMGRIVAATDEAGASSIIHWVDEQTGPGEAGPSRVIESWTDETSDATRMRVRFQDGQHDVNVDVGPLAGPAVDSPAHSGQRVVNYCTRQFVDHIETDGASTDVDADALGGLRDDVAAGRLIEDGIEVVDGRELIRLIGRAQAPTAREVVLVDPDTYLPVRARGTMETGERFSQTYEYLPRTAENLALLLPPIPEGFTQVDPLGAPAHPATCDGR